MPRLIRAIPILLEISQAVKHNQYWVQLGLIFAISETAEKF